MKLARNLETFLNRSFVKAVLQNVTLLIRLVKKKLKNIKNVNINSSPLCLLLFSRLRIAEFSLAMNISSVSTRVQTFLIWYKTERLLLVSERRYLTCCQDSATLRYEIQSGILAHRGVWDLQN